MCKFASFIITKDREYWCESDRHEDIVEKHGLSALDKTNPPGLVRIEILPKEQSRQDISTWKYCVDQDVFPEWTFAGDPELERRAREALVRRAAEETWFADVIGHQATSGYAGTATAGDDGILQIRWHDGKRYRIAIFYVGENGVEPNVKYRLDNKGQIVRAE